MKKKKKKEKEKEERKKVIILADETLKVETEAQSVWNMFSKYLLELLF